MAAESESMAHPVNGYDDEQQSSNFPKTSQRKSSFSEALTKFKSNTFNRRRTTTGVSGSISSIAINQHSRIPTPAGIDRSASFFSTLSTFTSKPTASMSEESPQPSLTKRSRKISERLAQTPFFSHQHQQQSASTPRSNRESSVKIEQRGLMQPVHPPLPRSNTIGNLPQSQQGSPLTPSFMRPTTSSARRSSIMGRSNTAAPSSMVGRGSAATQRPRDTSLRTIADSSTPSKTPTKARRVPAPAIPSRSDSLISVPSMTNEAAPAFDLEKTVTQPDMPTDYSDGANFQVTDHRAQEMAVAKISNNGKPRSATDLMHETRRAPQAKGSKQGILKSKNKNRILSEGLSNLYDDDGADTSKEEREHSEIKPRSDRGTPECSERTVTPESSNPRLIHEAQPHLWWLGRYTALSDRFRTGALPSPPSSPSRSHSSANRPSPPGLTSGPSSNANHPMHDADRRSRRVYVHLRSLCTTDDARASLEDFRAMMEAREKKMTAGAQGKAVKEKQGWLEGLMGKKKKGEK